MAMKKILTAACVLAAASTVAAAGSGVKAAQPGGSSYIMDLRKAQEDVSSGKPETNIDLGEGISGEVQENLFAEYEKYGIVNENGVLYYHNKPIRCFADTCKIIENMNEYGGKTITYKNICTYVNWAGSIDLYTVREEIEKKAGSSLTFGKIESIEQASSIEDLASSVSAQSLMKIVEIGYGETWNSEVYKIIPFLPHEFVDNFAIQAAENGNYDGVKDLLPFLSEETVAQIADKEYDRIENGTSKRSNATNHKIRNTFLGNLCIHNKRNTITTIIITEAEKLISSRLISTTSFQISNNFFQVFYLLFGKFFSAK